MALTPASCSFYWEASFGIRPLKPPASEPTFTRSGRAWTKARGGRWIRVDANVPRFRWLENYDNVAFAFDRAATNRATENVGFGTNSAANWSAAVVGGSTPGTISVVSGREDYLRRAGLMGSRIDLVDDGYLVKLDCSGADGRTEFSIPKATTGGGTQSTNKHYLAVWARGTTGSDQITLHTANTYAGGSAQNVSSELALYEQLITPNATGDKMIISVPVGDVVEVVLPWMDEGWYFTYPLPNENSGTDVTGAAEHMYWPGLSAPFSTGSAIYFDMIIRGTIGATGNSDFDRFWHWGGSTRMVRLYAGNADGRIGAALLNGTDPVATIAVNPTLAQGDRVQGVVTLDTNDDKVKLCIRVNEDDTTFASTESSALTSGMPATMSEDRLYLSSSESGGNKGSCSHLKYKIIDLGDFGETTNTLAYLKEALKLTMNRAGM